MLPADLPPLPAYTVPGSLSLPAPPVPLIAKTPIANAASDKIKIPKTQEAFEKAVKVFQEGLAKLPDNHKQEISKLHGEVELWADNEHSSGKKADKLATFVGKVMTYLHQRLLVIETTDPQLTKLKSEHRQLQKLFLQGDDVINAYLAWVKDKKATPIERPVTNKTAP